MKRIAISACLMAAAIAVAADADAKFAEDYRTPIVQAPYAEEKPVIDGRIDEVLWDRSLYLNALRCKDRMMSHRPTAFWIAWDEDNIYVAMRSPLRKGEKPIRKFRDTERDINVVFDDAFEVFLGANSMSPDGQPVFFQYLCNFDGARYDAMHEPRVGNRREGWTANWEVKSTLNAKNEWEMEMRIPRETVYRDKFKDGEVVTMLIARDFKRPWEQNSFEGTSDFSVGESHTHVKLVRGRPVIRFLGAADSAKKTFGFDFEAASPKAAKLDWSFTTSGGFARKGTLEVPAGGKFVKPAGLSTALVHEDAKGHCRVMVKQGSEVLLDWITDMYFTPGYEQNTEFDKPDPGDRIELSTVYNPEANVLRLTADFIQFDARDKIEKSIVHVTDAGGKEVASAEFPLDDRAYCRGTMKLPAIGGGDYKVRTDVVGKDGKVVSTVDGAFRRIDAAKKWPFVNTKAGNPEKVLAPWTPVRDKGATVSVWGRDMTVGAAGLPEQVTSQGNALLARPASLTLVDAEGNSFAAKLEGKPKKTFDKDWRKTYETVSKAGALTVRAKTTVEYDGMYKVEMTLVPPTGGVKTKSLKFVLPVAGEFARYVYGTGAEIRSGFDLRWLPEKGDRDGVLWDSRKVDSQPMLVGSFIPYVWLGAEKGGICFFADKDEGWVPNDDVPAIQFVRNGKDVDMVFNFISSDFDLDAPRTIVFALEASPVKPLVGDWRSEKWWCGYTFEFSGGCSWVYPKGGGSMIWQSRPNTVDIEACKAKVDEFHGVGRIAVPYFEYNMMTDVKNSQVDFTGIQDYYGDAWRMDSGNILCYGGSLQDYIIWNLDHWIKSCGIDGWYLDNVRPCFSSDIDAGYGYRLPDGRVQPEFNMFAMRRFFLRLRAVFQENGKKTHIVNHMTNNMIIPWNGPCDVAYDGEANVIFWGSRKDGVHQTDFMDVWPLERLFTANPGIWGINVNFMHEYQGNWQQFCTIDQVKGCYRAYEGAVMLHDALPTGNNGDTQQLDFMKPRRDFGFETNDKIEFLPYWRAKEGGLTADQRKGIYSSAWLDRDGRKALVIVTNWKDAQKARIELDFARLGVAPDAKVYAAFNCKDLKPGAEIPHRGGKVAVEVGRHNYVLLLVAGRPEAERDNR